MFIRMTRTEAIIFSQGLAIFLLVVAFGVVAAEHQLNSLTLQYDFVQVLNFAYGKGVYSAYLLGNQYSFGSMYPIGKIENNNGILIIEVAKSRLILPTVIKTDISALIYWLELWSRQFIDEALKTKNNFEHYLSSLPAVWNQMINFIKAYFP